MSRKKNTLDSSAVNLITVTDSSSPVAEQYRVIRTNIQYSMVDREIKTLAITSPDGSEGKSTLAANLAVVFANAGQRVLLVDTDLRRPTVARTFMLGNYQGLSTLLSKNDMELSNYVQPSGVSNLDVLTSGPVPPNPSEMLGSARMKQLLEHIKQQYDLIIFDVPPVVAVTDAQIVSSMVDGTLIVVREKQTRKTMLQNALQLLYNVNARILGVVYNDAANSKEYGYGYYRRDEE